MDWLGDLFWTALTWAMFVWWGLALATLFVACVILPLVRWRQTLAGLVETVRKPGWWHGLAIIAAVIAPIWAGLDLTDGIAEKHARICDLRPCPSINASLTLLRYLSLLAGIGGGATVYWLSRNVWRRS